MIVGTKTIKTTRSLVVHVCDRCDRHLDSWRSCKICHREVGYCCSSLMLAYDPGQQGAFDLGFYVCKDCEEAGKDVAGTPYIDLIRDKVKAADAYVLAVLEWWSEWAKERREKGGATT